MAPASVGAMGRFLLAISAMRCRLFECDLRYRKEVNNERNNHLISVEINPRFILRRW